MENGPHPIVAEHCEAVKKHSTRIRTAQKELREAIRAAERDRIPEEALYI